MNRLLPILFLHLAFTALPGVAATLVAARRGERDEPVLLGIGLAGSGITAMLAFWAYYADRGAGAAFAYVIPVVSTCLIAWSLSGHSPEPALLKRLTTPLVLWAVGATFLVSLGFLHGGTDRSIATAQTRFSHELPSDNYLPLYFSEWFFAHGHDGVPPPFPGEWLASDRPPLQMGYVLAQRALYWRGGADLDYQVLGVLLQQLWIVGLWALLVAGGAGSTTRGLTMLVVLVSDLAIVNGFYVWPKLLAATFVLAAAALVVSPRRADLRRSMGGASLLAALAALALLAHAASLFALIPLAMLGMAGGLPRVRWITVAVLVGGLLMVPWSAYQRYGNPPGNRLTKWMIGGFGGIDDRGALETVVASYRQVGWRGALHNKEENFITMSGGVPALAIGSDAMKAVRAGEIGKALFNLRVIAFFYTLPSCGLLVLLAPVAMVVARGRPLPAEWPFALTCSALFVSGSLVWGFLMFGSDDTRAVIHAGSLALPILALCGAASGLRSTFPRLAVYAIVTRVLATLILYLPSLVPHPGLRYSPPAALLTAVSLAVFAAVAFGLEPFRSVSRQTESVLLVGRDRLTASRHWWRSAADPLQRYPLDSLAVSLALAAIPFAFLVFLVWRSYVDVPFWDEWEIVTRLQRIHDGTFSFLDLWGQHNEHRPLFGIGLVLLLARLTHWNVGAEIAANVVIGALIFGVVAGRVISFWPRHARAPFWLLPLLSLFAFSPNQWENWLWGWQVTLFLNVLAVCTGLALLSRLEGRWTRLVGAMACGIVATYSFAAGLVFWGSGTLAWSLNRTRPQPAQMFAWATVALLTIGSYFYDYHANPGHPSIRANFTGLGAFTLYLIYVAKYLGAAVATYDRTLAATAGGSGIALLAGLAWANRRHFGEPVYSFAILLGAHTVAVALMTGLGRAGFGTDQSLVSRYVTVSTPLWFAVLVLAALLVSRLRADDGVPVRWPIAQAGLMSVVVLTLVVGIVASGEWGTRMAYDHQEQLAPARRALITGHDDVLLGRLYPVVPELRNRREALIAWHLSVFRSARAQREP